MRPLIYLMLAFGLITVAACEKDIPTCEQCEFTCLDGTESAVVTNDCDNAQSCSFEVFTNRKIVLEEENISFENDSENVVFEYQKSSNDDPYIADDEIFYNLVFQLPQEQTSFSVADNQLSDLELYFRKVCFCSNTDWQPIISGCLQGEKLETGEWAVQGNLIFEEYTLLIDAFFE